MLSRRSSHYGACSSSQPCLPSRPICGRKPACCFNAAPGLRGIHSPSPFAATSSSSSRRPLRSLPEALPEHADAPAEANGVPLYPALLSSAVDAAAGDVRQEEELAGLGEDPDALQRLRRLDPLSLGGGELEERGGEVGQPGRLGFEGVELGERPQALQRRAGDVAVRGGELDFGAVEQPSALQKLFNPDEELPDNVEMPLIDHLEELRERVLLSALAAVVAIGGCFCFSKELILFLEAPVAESGVRFLQLSPGEFFFTTVKTAGYSGLLLAAPTVLYQIIAYVVPALTRSEKRFLAPVVFGSSILFYFGYGEVWTDV